MGDESVGVLECIISNEWTCQGINLIDAESYKMYGCYFNKIWANNISNSWDTCTTLIFTWVQCIQHTSSEAKIQ